MLTVKKIEALIKAGVTREVPDGSVRGLYFAPVSKAWRLRYRHRGKPRSYTLDGRWPELGLALAREIATGLRADIVRGGDPAVEKQTAKAAVTEPRDQDLVERVGEQFILRHIRATMKASWAHEAERMVRKEIIGAWKGRRLSEIGRAEIHDLLDTIVDRPAPVLAEKVFKTFRRLCGWAIERGIIERSPCDGIKSKRAEKSRDRVLNDDELRGVWQASETQGWPFGPLVQLLILTGQRLAEVAEMRWSEIDFAGKTWTLPKERSKNGQAHQVPLSPQAITILESLPRIAGDRDLVFTTNGKTAVSGFSKAKARLGLALPDAPHWTFHDLRRTAATGMARLAVSIPVIEKVLNHVSGSFAGIVGVYQRHGFGDEKREALDLWGRHLEAIASEPGSNNVVDIRAA